MYTGGHVRTCTHLGVVVSGGGVGVGVGWCGVGESA